MKEVYKHIDKLYVYQGKDYVGVLKRTSTGCELEFDTNYFNNPNHPFLTYQISKQSKVYKTPGINLPPFFAGLLPEGLRFKALVKEIKTSDDDLFSLLAASGEQTVGDINVKRKKSEEPKEIKAPNLNEVIFYDLFKKNLKNGFTLKGDESFSGAQEKLSASMISFPLRIAKKNKFYILKLNPSDKPNLVYNEHQCLLLAKSCGIDANRSQIVFDKNKNPGLLIERFDRQLTENGDIVKVHQEDACQFLNKYPADKYRLSFNEICEAIGNFATAPSIELLKTLQLYIFSYLMGNGDLHSKNISLQTDYKTGRIQLTPAYDIICTYLYKDQKMALKLDSRDTNFKRRYFIEFGERFGIEKKAIEYAIDKLIYLLNKNQHLLIQIPNLTAKEKDLITNLVTSRIKCLN